MITAQPVGEASSAPDIRDRSVRKRVLLTSLALGIFVLLAVPIHSASMAEYGVLTDERYVFAACNWPFPLAPEPVCPLVFAGESPFMVLYALVTAPLLLVRGRTRTMLTTAILSLTFALVQIASPFYTILPTSFFLPICTPVSFHPRSSEIPPPADWCFVDWTIPYSTSLKCPFFWPWRSSATGLTGRCEGRMIAAFRTQVKDRRSQMIAAKLHHRARQPELLAVLGIVGAATLTGAAVVSRRRSMRRGAPGAPPIAKAGNSFVSPLIGHELNFSGHRFHILESARDTDDGSQRFDYTAPPGVPHAWWNPSDDEEVRFLGGIRPGLDVETWLETVLGLMRDGKTIGPVPRNPLQLAVLAREVGSWLVLTPVENVLFAPVVLLAFVGSLLGYRARYPEYGGPDDQTAPIR